MYGLDKKKTKLNVVQIPTTTAKCILAFGYFVVKLYESNYQYIFQTCISCHNHVRFEAIIHTLTSDQQFNFITYQLICFMSLFPSQAWKHIARNKPISTFSVIELIHSLICCFPL